MAQPGAVLPSSSPLPPKGPTGVPVLVDPSGASAAAVAPARRREPVLRKALPADPRMPIRLDRSAWRQLDPISQDETEALLVLDEITATPAQGDAATAGNTAHAVPPATPIAASAVLATSAPRAGAAVPTPAPTPSPQRSPAVMPPRPHPTLPPTGPSVSPGMRVLMVTVAWPWPALMAGLLALTLMTVSALAAQRDYQRELLHQQLLGIDLVHDFSAAQRQLWRARLQGYRQLVAPSDPEILRWSALLQR